MPKPSTTEDPRVRSTTAKSSRPRRDAGTTSVLGRFGILPRLAGRSFLPLGLVARLPLAMLTVGALTLVTVASDSYAIGGFAAGAVGVGSAVGAPVLGYLADRLGQRPILLIAAVVNTLAIIGLIVSSRLVPDYGPTSSAVVIAAAFVMGATCPQVGPLARVRWMALTGADGGGSGASDLDTALSYESTADELTFALGPALVGLLASAVAPWLPLALAAALTVTFVSAFAVHPTGHAVVPMPKRLVRAQRDSADRSASDRDGDRRGPRQWWRIAVPVAGMVCMGTFFGSTVTALTGFAGSFGMADAAGMLYALMGVTSAVAALSVAYWPSRWSHPARWIVSASVMVVLAAGLFLPTGIGTMVAALLVLGLPVGPTMVTIFSIGGIVAPEGRTGTVMTMLASGIVAGTALGTSVAGSLAERLGYSAALGVPACAAAGLLLLGLASVFAGRTRDDAAAAG